MIHMFKHIISQIKINNIHRNQDLKQKYIFFLYLKSFGLAKYRYMRMKDDNYSRNWVKHVINVRIWIF